MYCVYDDIKERYKTVSEYISSEVVAIYLGVENKELVSKSRLLRYPGDSSSDRSSPHFIALLRKKPRRVPPISPQKFSLAATQGQSTRNNAAEICVGVRPDSQLGRAGIRWQVDSSRGGSLLSLSHRVDEVKVARMGSGPGLLELG